MDVKTFSSLVKARREEFLAGYFVIFGKEEWRKMDIYCGQDHPSLSCSKCFAQHGNLVPLDTTLQLEITLLNGSLVL